MSDPEPSREDRLFKAVDGLNEDDLRRELKNFIRHSDFLKGQIQSQADEIDKLKQDRDHADDEVGQKNVEIELLKKDINDLETCLAVANGTCRIQDEGIIRKNNQLTIATDALNQVNGILYGIRDNCNGDVLANIEIAVDITDKAIEKGQK